MSYEPKVHREHGGAKQVVASGGEFEVQSGGTVDLQAGSILDIVGTWKIGGVAVTATAANLNGIWEDALAVYGIPVNAIMAADGAPLAVAETAGDHFLNLGTNTINLRGEEAISETETSVSYAQFVLPAEYVAAGDVTIRVRCKIEGAGTDNASSVDLSVYKQADMAVGGDICATAAQNFAAKSTWYSKDFSITATGLVAGDVLIIKLTTAVVESAGSALAFYAEPIKVLADVKG
jgi:hypothetical protein